MFQRVLFMLLAMIFFTTTAWSKNILCTTTPVWLPVRDIARNAPNINITLLMPPQHGCAHDYAPAPRDLAAAAKPGALLIANGLGLDDHIVSAVKKVNKDISTVYIADLSDKLDAHFFIVPGNAVLMVKNILKALSRFDPANKAVYQANGARYISELDKLSQKYRTLPRQQYVVLQGSIFIHLANALEYNAILARQQHDTVPGAGDLRKLMQKIKKLQPYAVWAEKNSSDPLINMLKKNTNLPIIELETLLQTPADPPADYFIKQMRYNFEILQKAAQK